jgi:putative phage-type endonuclease
MAELQQRTPAWHVARRGKLTASNLGAALGQVNYVSRVVAYRRALGLDKFQGNDATEWGNANEANGIVAYQSLTGNVVTATGLHIHPDYSWLAGSPDGFVGDEGMVEVKCPFYFRRDGSGRLHKQVPGHYYQQMNALMEICNREWCDYICWSPEGMVVYRVKRDRACFDFLLTYYGQFYAAMQAQADGPPPLAKEDKAKIATQLADALSRSVDYAYWTLADPSFPLPSSDPQESDEDEAHPGGTKRQRLPNLSGDRGSPRDTETPGAGEVASPSCV